MANESLEQRADRIFDLAMDLAPAERDELLQRECGDDAELRAKVERLLQHADTTISRELGTAGAFDLMSGMVPQTALDLRGKTLGRYRIEREIGHGGMGVVYEAVDERLDRHVAIKVLTSRRTEERVHRRFLREARAAAQLNHPNIVAIHDAGEADGWPYLVMERVVGNDLEREAPGSVDEVLQIASQICDALSHAHGRGLVHRDLKPGNVLVVRDSGKPVAKLADMGIALARGTSRVTKTGAVTGTPAFMAPEQALGQAVDGRTDLYSLGVMLYMWVAGRAPFAGDDALAVVSQHIHAPVVPPRTYCPDIPAGLESVILRLLAKAPEERFESADAVRRALEAIDKSDTESASVSIEGLTRGRLVNRHDELRQLKEHWAAARQSRCHLALVSGEPGVGKTRLAQEVIAMARLDGALVLTGGCYEHEATTPYLPFLEAFRRVASEREDERLRIDLGDTAAEIARLAPEIESRLGPFPPRPKLSPQEERLRLFDAVARFLRALAGETGLLFFLDDLQWADHGSLGLLHYLRRQLTDVGVLFLGTYREVELDRAHPLSKTLVDWDRERLTTRIRLDRLGAEDTRQMIRTLLGQAEVSGDLIDRVREETEGNPFFVEEILKSLIAEGGLVREHAAWRRRKTSMEFVLPQSVKAAVGSRLERVGKPCTDVLRTAAVLGKVFEFGELQAVANEDEDVLLDALDEAVQAHLIASGARDSFRFTHDKIREVLYEELNPIRRRRIHASIAEGLESLHAASGNVAVEDLAYHYTESGDYEKGLLYSDRAAQAALAVYAHEEALELLDRALECADALGDRQALLHLQESRGDAAFALGDVTAATEQYERTIESTEDPLQKNRLRAKCAEAYVISGDPQGLTHVQKALAELDRDDHPLVTAQAIAIEARYRHLRGELEPAAELYREALQLLESGSDRDLYVRVLSFFAGTLQHMANFGESDQVSERCIRIGEQENVPTGIMLGHEFLSENALYRGLWQRSVEHGEREESLAVSVHAGERYGWSHFRGHALYALGRLAEAEDVLQRGIKAAEQTGDRRLQIFLEGGLLPIYADTGRGNEVRELGRKVIGEADEASLVSHSVTLRGLMIDVLLRTNQNEEAAALAREATAFYRGANLTGMRLIHDTEIAEALFVGGERSAAHEILVAHRQSAERTESPHRIAQNDRVRARIAELDGDDEAALRRYGRALEIFDSNGSRLYLARTLEERAVVLDRRKRSSEADEDRQRSRSIREACGVTA